MLSVCLCIPLLTFECLNQSLWNLVCMSWHQSQCMYKECAIKLALAPRPLKIYCASPLTAAMIITVAALLLYLHMEASQHSLLAACFTLHSIKATLGIVPQRGAGLWIGTRVNVNGVIHKSLPSVCVCMGILLSSLGNGSVKTLLRQQIHKK
jgi:hypothetical protein